MERINSRGIHQVSSGARRRPPVSVRDEGGKDLKGGQNDVCKSYRGVAECGFPRKLPTAGGKPGGAQDEVHACGRKEPDEERKVETRVLLLIEQLFCLRLFPSGISPEDFNNLLTWFITPLSR